MTPSSPNPDQPQTRELVGGALRQRDEARKEVEEANRVAEGYLSNAVPTGCPACAEGVCCGSTNAEHVNCVYTALSSLQSQATRDAEEIKRLTKDLCAEQRESERHGVEIARLGPALSATEAECAKLREERDAAVALQKHTLSNVQSRDRHATEWQQKADAAAARVAELEKWVLEVTEHIEGCREDKLLECDDDPHPPSVFSTFITSGRALLTAPTRTENQP